MVFVGYPLTLTDFAGVVLMFEGSPIARYSRRQRHGCAFAGFKGRDKRRLSSEDSLWKHFQVNNGGVFM